MCCVVETDPWRGTTRPLCGRRLAARIFSGAVKFPRAVTWYVLCVPRPGPYHFDLREGLDQLIEVLLLTRSRLHVAGVALRTAVVVVRTANRLQGTAETINHLIVTSLSYNKVCEGLTLTRGQQPHSPVTSLQQVVPVAQLLLSSHLTSVTAPGSVTALSLVNQGTEWAPREQAERWCSQV